MANRSMAQLMTDFREVRTQFGTLEEKLPRIIGAECVTVVKDNFRLQGYDPTGSGVIAWPKRKASTNRAYSNRAGQYKGSVINADSPLLEQTMNLYNSIKYRTSGKNVRVGVELTTVPYAKIHNEGGTITVGARQQTMRFIRGKLVGKAASKSIHVKSRQVDVSSHVIKMPKRQYIPTDGPNLKMTRSIEKKVTYEKGRILKKFVR